MHTQGGAHKRRFVAATGVLFFKGPHAWRYTQKAIHKRQCTQKAVCSHRRSLVIQGATGKAVHTQGGTHKRRSVAATGVLFFKGPHAWRYTQKAIHKRQCTQKAVCSHRRSLVIQGATGKAVHTQGGAHKRRSVATAGVLLFKRPQARRCIHKEVQLQGGACTRRCTQKAVCSHRGRIVV